MMSLVYALRVSGRTHAQLGIQLSKHSYISLLSSRDMLYSLRKDPRHKGIYIIFCHVYVYSLHMNLYAFIILSLELRAFIAEDFPCIPSVSERICAQT